MLRIRFLNVGDGDAMLLEAVSGGRAYRLLVDTGRECVPPEENSLRGTAAEFLLAQGVTKLDCVIITHLHADHQGGLAEIARRVPIGELITGYVPRKLGGRIPEGVDAERTVVGMIDCVNRFSEDLLFLSERGTAIRAVEKTRRDLSPAPGLHMDLIVPDEALLFHEKRLWDGMMAGEDFGPEEKYRASKARNPASLRLRLRYAGREIELAGDCYGSVWDGEELAPCDLFKVPHHADAKAITPALIQKLRPAHAIISCAREHNPIKDRPSACAIGLLRGAGARVWFTDSFEENGRAATARRSLDFCIAEDGRILPPERGADEREETT